MRAKVLIVDDDTVDRVAVRRALRANGIALTAEEASSCAEALEKLRASDFDCVVLDYLLPDGTGLSVIQDARETGDRCPFVVLTGQGDEQTAVELMKAGAADYLPKRAGSEHVAQAVRNAIRVHRAERQARETEARLRRQLDVTTAITGSLAEGVCAFDGGGRIMFANAAAGRILGTDPTALLGRDVVSFASSSEAASGLLSAVFTGSVLRVDDDVFLRADGAMVPVSFAASPILTDGEVTGGVLAFHDATARKASEAELEASRRQLAQTEKLSALGTLVSGVAHELRTPLTYLSNNLFLLQARMDAAAREDASLAPLVEETRRFSRAAIDGVDRINALVRDLRPFSSTGAGERLDADLREIAAAAVDLFRATQRGRVDVAARLDPAFAAALDRGQVQRVVINLLVNAAEAMGNGGMVRVATRVEGDRAVLEVEDEGGGIPEDVQERIFDPFFTTKAEGTGLGLAITRRIIEAHGGTIGFATQIGEGTRFRVELPRAQASTEIRVEAGPSGASPQAPLAPAAPAPPTRPR